MKIYHISDIHINNTFLPEWRNYIRKAFIDYVNNTKDSDSIIVCTGDLIDKGGIDFGGAEKAFKIFEDEFITPVISRTGITIDHFVLCPGNHDIERSKDESYVISGVRSEIKDNGSQAITSISTKILDNDFSPSKRILEYVNFVRHLYSGCSNVHISNLGVAFEYNIAGQRIGVASFNSVWNSCDDKDQEFGLAVGEPQYNFLNECLKQCDVKIAAIHHPLDWLLYEKNTVVNWLTTDYDLILLGHIHENETCMSQKPNVAYAYNISPSFSADIRGISGVYVNGFTEIDLSQESQEVICHYHIFDIKKRDYKLNTSYCENGIFEFSYKRDGSNLSALITRCLKHIQDEFFPKIDSSLIPQKAQTLRTLDDLFVMPPLRRNGDDSHKDYSLSDILKKSSNVVFFGNGESGKTILLYKCLKDLVRDYSIYQRVPVYIDFSVNTNQDFTTIIKTFLSCNSKEVEKLIDEGKIILLVDNYSVEVEYKERKSKLYRFIAEKPIRMIATVEYGLPDSIPMSFVEGNEISVESFFIHQFNAAKVKELMEKWAPTDDAVTRIDKIEKMVDKFCSYSLPCSAMSVSLYLWSTEENSRAPINSAYLLDIYLEIILEKIAIDNVYRETFNYNNKCNLLGYIAEQCNQNLNDNPQFILTKGGLVKMAEDYLNDVGYIQFKADRLIDYFIQQRIFIQEGNDVHYSHACFFYFFLAKRMIAKKEFREEIMAEGNYFKYERVLDYYSGLVMTDVEWLKKLFNRFEDYFSTAYDVIQQQINIDNFFTKIVDTDTNKRFTPIAKKISPTTIVNSKPTIQEVEKRTLAVSDERLSRIKDKITRDGDLSMSNLLIMMSKSLRNMEDVEDMNLKQKIYNSIIRNSIVYNVLTKDSLAYYANTHNGELPPCFANVKNVYSFLIFMPFIFQYNLNDLMGTPKLQKVFETKFAKDKSSQCSDLEKYFSIAMMWDVANVKYEQDYRHMIRSVGNNSVQDYLLLKLLDYFRNRVVLGSDIEDIYIGLIADAKVKTHRLGRLKKGEIIRQMKNERKRLLIERKSEER